MKRKLFSVQDIVDATDGSVRELAQLADDLNDGLSPDYEVVLLHLDTVDYLAFTLLDPDTIEEEDATPE